MMGAVLHISIVGPVAVEPHEKYTFEPGIVGIELRELKQDIKRSDTLPMTLEFAGGVLIDVKVEFDSRSAVRYPPPGDLPPAKAAAH
jgi:copper(I)-binding protein